MLKNRFLFIVLALYAIIALLTMIFMNGTGDAGDSVHHYLFARYAPDHPELFFDHWAKPLYVLLASPFAQFGFIGVKIFNVLITFFTLLVTYKVAQKLELKNTVLSIVFIVFAPLSFVLTYSGLTEPLFALLLSLGIYYSLKNKFILAALIISFLPFVRSEGLILIGIFGLYFLLKKEWKAIPMLLAGHVLYSIAGSFVHDDILWVFTKIPYAHMSSVYGRGGLFHFVEQMVYIVGIPIYALLSAGVVSVIIKSFQQKVKLELLVLVFMGFGAFFVAHSLFWYLGIFNSMGLSRVFVAVMPLIAILALNGFNFITEEFPAKQKVLRNVLQALFIALVLIFPFTKNPAAINFERDLMLNPDQETAKQTTAYIERELGTPTRYIHSHPYLSCVLDIDHFDSEIRVGLDQYALDHLQTGDLIIWENWFALVEYGITEENLNQHSELTLVHRTTNDDRGREIVYAVYRKN